MFELGCITFFIVWILKWGSVTTAEGVSSWSLNFVLSLLHEVFITSILRVFIINVLVIEATRPILQRHHDSLVKLNETRGSEVEDGDVCILRHLSPSRAAVMSQAMDNLVAAQLLRTAMDSDLFQS